MDAAIERLSVPIGFTASVMVLLYFFIDTIECLAYLNFYEGHN